MNTRTRLTWTNRREYIFTPQAIQPLDGPASQQEHANHHAQRIGRQPSPVSSGVRQVPVARDEHAHGHEMGMGRLPGMH